MDRQVALLFHDRSTCPLLRPSDLISTEDSGRTSFPEAVPAALNFRVAAAVASNTFAMATSKYASCTGASVAVAGRAAQTTQPAGDALSVMHRQRRGARQTAMAGRCSSAGSTCHTNALKRLYVSAVPDNPWPRGVCGAFSFSPVRKRPPKSWKGWVSAAIRASRSPRREGDLELRPEATIRRRKFLRRDMLL
jgi:hypothetical protein